MQYVPSCVKRGLLSTYTATSAVLATDKAEVNKLPWKKEISPKSRSRENIDRCPREVARFDHPANLLVYVYWFMSMISRFSLHEQ